MEEFFNPSAAYLPARKVALEYEAAKNMIGRAIGAKGSDIVITAGATEANNLAFSAVDDAGASAACPSGNSSQAALAKFSYPLGHTLKILSIYAIMLV